MAFPTVGVLAIVEGMRRFEQDTDQVKKRLGDLEASARSTAKGTGVLTTAAGGLSGALGSVLTIAAGILAADVFKRMAGAIGGLVKNAFDAAASLQKLDIQFNTLVARELKATNSTEGFAEHLENVVGLSEYQVQRFKNLRGAHDLYVKKLDELDRAGMESGQQFADYTRRLEYTDGQIRALIPGFDALDSRMQNSAFGTYNFTQALEDAKGPADALLQWAINMSVRTPFTPETISTATSLAMAMGFTSNETKRLITNVGNFTSGMGLSDEVMTRIIYNFGQMRSAGKVTGTELRDLARGAMVPVNDILEQMRQNLGMTGMSFDAFKKLAGEGGVPVEAFFEAFQQIAESDFPGAMERMSTTWQGVTQDFQDFMNVVLGSAIMRPIIDMLSGGLRGLIDSMTTPEALQKLETTKGLMLSILDSLTGLATSLADALGIKIETGGLVDTLNGFLRGIGIPLRQLDALISGEVALPDLLGRLFGGGGDKPAFFDKILPAIGRVMEAVGPIIDKWSPIFSELFGKLGEALGVAAPKAGGTVIDTIVSVLDKLASWITANEDVIDNVITQVGTFITWVTEELVPALSGPGVAAFSTFVQGLTDVIMGLVGALLSLMAGDWGALGENLTLIGEGLVTGIGDTIANLSAGIFEALTPGEGTFEDAMSVWYGPLAEQWGIIMDALGPFLATKWQETVNKALTTIGTIFNGFAAINAALFQRGTDMIQGLWDGIQKKIDAMKAWLKTQIDAILALWDRLLGMHSPSTEMAKRGEMMIAGLQKGMQAGLRAGAGMMANAASQQAPAMAMAGGGNSTTTIAKTIIFQPTITRDVDGMAMLQTMREEIPRL